MTGVFQSRALNILITTFNSLRSNFFPVNFSITQFAWEKHYLVRELWHSDLQGKLDADNSR